AIILIYLIIFSLNINTDSAFQTFKDPTANVRFFTYHIIEFQGQKMTVIPLCKNKDEMPPELKNSNMITGEIFGRNAEIITRHLQSDPSDITYQESFKVKITDRGAEYFFSNNSLRFFTQIYGQNDLPVMKGEDNNFLIYNNRTNEIINLQIMPNTEIKQLKTSDGEKLLLITEDKEKKNNIYLYTVSDKKAVRLSETGKELKNNRNVNFLTLKDGSYIINTESNGHIYLYDKNNKLITDKKYDCENHGIYNYKDKYLVMPIKQRQDTYYTVLPQIINIKDAGFFPNLYAKLIKTAFIFNIFRNKVTSSFFRQPDICPLDPCQYINKANLLEILVLRANNLEPMTTLAVPNGDTAYVNDNRLLINYKELFYDFIDYNFEEDTFKRITIPYGLGDETLKIFPIKSFAVKDNMIYYFTANRTIQKIKKHKIKEN
ncbi:MAG: hypothetical protein KBT47_07835, partial [Armatimonadetes bacterium]|nr:hypothetical protein [Candidatus Hippobium faecium]